MVIPPAAPSQAATFESTKGTQPNERITWASPSRDRNHFLTGLPYPEETNDQILHMPTVPENFTNNGGALDFYIDDASIEELFPGKNYSRTKPCRSCPLDDCQGLRPRVPGCAAAPPRRRRSRWLPKPGGPLAESPETASDIVGKFSQALVVR
jgi:hypothetical protein